MSDRELLLGACPVQMPAQTPVGADPLDFLRRLIEVPGIVKLLARGDGAFVGHACAAADMLPMRAVIHLGDPALVTGIGLFPEGGDECGVMIRRDGQTAELVRCMAGQFEIAQAFQRAGAS